MWDKLGAAVKVSKLVVGAGRDGWWLAAKQRQLLGCGFLFMFPFPPKPLRGFRGGKQKHTPVEKSALRIVNQRPQLIMLATKVTCQQSKV